MVAWSLSGSLGRWVVDWVIAGRRVVVEWSLGRWVVASSSSSSSSSSSAFAGAVPVARPCSPSADDRDHWLVTPSQARRSWSPGRRCSGLPHPAGGCCLLLAVHWEGGGGCWGPSRAHQSANIVSKGVKGAMHAALKRNFLPIKIRFFF